MKVLASTILFAAAIEAKNKHDYHYVTKGHWGKWKTYKECPAKTALCGISMRIEPWKGKARDDTATNGIKFKCCNIESAEKWESDQSEITAYKGYWGVWSDFEMCNPGTFIMGMDALMDPKTSFDDTSMGGAKIICDSLTEENLNTHKIDT